MSTVLFVSTRCTLLINVFSDGAVCVVLVEVVIIVVVVNSSSNSGCNSGSHGY